MKIPPKQLEKFKKIYSQEFGVELSDAEATEKAIYVLNFFKVMFLPIDKRRGVITK